MLGPAESETNLIQAHAASQSVTFTENSLVRTKAKVVAGSYHSLELDADGTVWTWGDNSQGQLGDGTDVSRTVPFQNALLDDVVDLAGGAEHTAAVKSDGTVWAWGANWSGQLGDGTTDQHFVPSQVPYFSGAIAVSAGAFHTIALRADGTVWGWGYNSDGELGNNSTDDSLVPVEVVTESGDPLTGVTAIAAGDEHNLAIRSDGTVWTWGANWNGQLGDGTYDNRYFAAQVPGLSNVALARAGAQHSIVVGSNTVPQGASSLSQADVLQNEATSPSVWGWGYNRYAQLGNYSGRNSNVPVLVEGLQDVVDLAAGGDHNLALRSGGTVLGWGSNGKRGNHRADNPTGYKPCYHLKRCRNRIYSIG